jgi:hypothetical protein
MAPTNALSLAFSPFSSVTSSAKIWVGLLYDYYMLVGGLRWCTHATNHPESVVELEGYIDCVVVDFVNFEETRRAWTFFCAATFLLAQLRSRQPHQQTANIPTHLLKRGAFAERPKYLEIHARQSKSSSRVPVHRAKIHKFKRGHHHSPVQSSRHWSIAVRASSYSFG